MIDLLIHEPTADDGATARTVFGGRPSVAPGFAWPVCAACEGNMQFLGQLRVPAPGSEDERLLLLFMCQNDPGLCNEWDPNDGGNAVIPAALDDLALADPPADGETVRDTRYAAIVEPVEAPDYDAARTAWTEASSRRGREILGQLGGEPAWLQGDETPDCDTCGKPMRFAAQLEQGPDHQTEMNFGGGGVAYVFECRKCAQSAKFLWQC